MQPPPLRQDLKANLIKMLLSILLTAKQGFMYFWSVRPIMVLITQSRLIFDLIYVCFMKNKTFEISLKHSDGDQRSRRT